MNLVQRFALNFTSRVVPQLHRLFESAGGTLDRVSDELEMLRASSSQSAIARRELAGLFREAACMGGAGPWQGPANLKETIADLELALEDQGWRRQAQMSETEFSRWGIQQLILITRLYWIKNPLVRRGVDVSATYVFGLGVEIRSEDNAENMALQEFLNDPANAAELGQFGLTEKERTLHTDGNLFFAFFASESTGRVQIRTIDATEIFDRVSDPDDAAKPLYFNRRWNQLNFDIKTGTYQIQAQESWYPALGVERSKIPETIGGKPVEKDVPILHCKVGTLPKWKFGVPLAYPALDWARAYKHFLEDWVTINRALARFSWNVETKGGQQAIAGLKTAFETTLGTAGSISPETNPPPTTGAAWISGPGNKVTPFRTAGATNDPEQGRRVMLMVAAAFGLPETFLGDVSVGTLATATSLDRPTELKFKERQEYWREILQTISNYVLDRSEIAPNGKLREAAKARESKNVVVGRQITVEFPDLLQHNVNEKVLAIVNAMTLGGRPVTGIDEKVGVGMLLAELGVEDVQAVLEAMYPEDEYDPDRTAEEETDPPPMLPGGAPVPPASPREAAIQRAVAELRKAVKTLRIREEIHA